MTEAPSSRKPRLVPIPGSPAYAFIHECCVCGSPDAYYGEGVHIRRGEPGRWYCRWHAAERAKEQAAARVDAGAKRSAAKPQADENPRDLFSGGSE